jgi:hypothetical protein
MAIAGINVFTDYESKSKHKRISLGLEYQRANFSANINKYHVFSDENDIAFPSPPSIIILLLRSTQASAPKSILRLSLKA